ncbi:MAG: helix-turn-helix transcriptional regulator [Treponema sp.]|nr:helix-turn-helix transcriptional regulator [Treponema sp.]
MKKISSWAAVTWLLHFFTVVVSSVIIIAMLTAAHEKMLLRTISSMTDELVQYAALTGQQVRKMLTACTYQNFYNPQVAKLRTHGDISNFDSILAIRVLNSFTSSNSFINSVYVYNGKKDYIYSTQETGSSDSAHFPDREAARILTACGKQYPYLIFRGNVYSLIIFETDGCGRCDNAMMVNLDATEFNKLYFQFPYDNCMLYRPDTDEIVFHAEGFVPSPAARASLAAIKEQTALSGYVTGDARAAGTSFIYSYLADPQLYYIRYIDSFKLMYELQNFKTLALQVVCVIAVSWAAILLLVLFRLYVPLKKVVEALLFQPGQNESAPDTVLTNIDQYVQKERVYKEAHTAILKKECIKQLLISPPHEFDVARSFKKYAIAFDVQKPVYLVLTSLADMPCNDAFIGIAESVLYDEGTVFIAQFLNDKAATDYMSCLVRTCSTRVFVSRKIDQWHEVHHSFARLQELSRAALFYPDTQVFFENFLDTRKGDMWYPEEHETRLMQALRSGNGALAQTLFLNIVRELAAYRYAAIIFSLKKLYLNLATLLNALTQDGACDALHTSVDYITDIIENARDTNVVWCEYYALMETICLQSGKNRAQKQQKLAHTIEQLVRDKLYDPQLSSKMIADSLHLSDAYVRRVFKSAEKVSLANYINSVRMKHARELLLTTDLTVKEIATQIGILNNQYFYVLFKKQFGMSPAQFKARAKNTRSNIVHVK